MKTLKVHLVEVNGTCLNSAYLSECLRRYFGANSCELVKVKEEAEVIVLNGCNVVGENADIATSYRDYARLHPGKRVLVLGCAPALGADGEKDAGFEVLPFWRLAREPQLLEAVAGARSPFVFLSLDEVLPKAVRDVWGKEDGGQLCYLNIGSGCRSRCAYCAIKHGRGPLRSLPADDVLAAARAGAERGRTRFVLVCDDVSCWGEDLGSDLAELLKALRRQHPAARFVLPSFNPQRLALLGPKLEELWASVDFLSLPIQSGSDRLLRLMRRDYEIGPVLDFVRFLRRSHPGLRLNTDVIVGFPTETRAEFAASVRAAKLFDSAVFPVFAPHPGTAAAALPPVDPGEVRLRMAAVRRLKAKHAFSDGFQEPAFL